MQNAAQAVLEETIRKMEQDLKACEKLVSAVNPKKLPWEDWMVAWMAQKKFLKDRGFPGVAE